MPSSIPLSCNHHLVLCICRLWILTDLLSLWTQVSSTYFLIFGICLLYEMTLKLKLNPSDQLPAPEEKERKAVSNPTEAYIVSQVWNLPTS